MDLRERIPGEFVGELDDGTALLFRPIRPDDKERIRAGFARLSPESRYRRFFRSIDHLTEEQLEYLTDVDHEDHVAWVAVLKDDPGQPGLGVARWVRAGDDPSVAEAAVTVIDDYQGRGIGATLLRLVTAAAIARGIRRFRAWTLGDNRPVLDLLKRLGATPGQWDSGVLELTVELPAAAADLPSTPAPLILEAVAAGRLMGEAGADEMMRTQLGPADDAPG